MSQRHPLLDPASGYLLNSSAPKVATYPVETEGEQLFTVIEDSAP